MSVLSDIFEGIKTVLTDATNGVDPGKPVHIYLGTPDAINDFPAIYVRPEDPMDMEVAFAGNSFKGTMRLTTFIRVGDDEDGWRQLWDYMDPVQGTKSVTRALRADLSLNSTVDSAGVREIRSARKAAEGVFAFDILLDYIVRVA